MPTATKKPAPLTLETFRAAAKSTGTPCSLSSFLAKLSPAEAGETRKAIRDESVPCEAIARVLRDRGCSTSGEAVRRHRRAGCARCRIDGRP